MSPEPEQGCLTCRLNSGDLPSPGGVIYQDVLWQLQHVDSLALVGWLVLKPLRHVEAFAELTAEEAATFGPLVRRITRVMTEVLQPVKVYLSLYAEAPGFAHLHVHLIPRSDDVPLERRGPGIFEYLREGKGRVPTADALAEVEQIVAALRRAL